ncbi:MAG: hypothetical protein LQ340_003770 [Diploschistes diacapsis]|nr:MAG: hypothetical protein LQ340_003770 [Diploschistes diacapsis]
MGVQKTVIKPGNGKDYPAKGDTVTMEYTGNLFDHSAEESNHYRGLTARSGVVTSQQTLELARSSKVRPGSDEIASEDD